MSDHGLLWFDRDTRPITMDEWCDLRARGEVYVRVALTDIGHVGEQVRVSTVWTGINNAVWPDAPPLVFQTAVFGGPLDGVTTDYTTQHEAQQGHDAMVGLVMREVFKRG